MDRLMLVTHYLTVPLNSAFDSSKAGQTASDVVNFELEADSVGTARGALFLDRVSG